MSDIDEGFTDWCDTESVRLVQQRQWVRYRIRLDAGAPDREFEWRDEMYSYAEPDEAKKGLAFWITVAGAIIVVAILIALASMRTASAEICHRNPSSDEVERKGGYRWQWRTVDGRKCWYYSNMVLPREELVWSYTEKEFNSDVDRVIERRFYTKEELEALDLIRQFGIKP